MLINEYCAALTCNIYTFICGWKKMEWQFANLNSVHQYIVTKGINIYMFASILEWAYMHLIIHKSWIAQ